MKKSLISSPSFSLRLACVFILQATVLLASKLAEDLSQYRDKTSTALAAETNPKAKKYLQDCLKTVEPLNGLEPGDPRLSGALADVGRHHQELGEILSPDPVPGETGKTKSSVTDQVVAETKAFVAHMTPYVRAEYVVKTKLQADLLERKYFNTETVKNSNFIEGYINGRWSLTRADDRQMDGETLGVQPWEAIARFEPTLAMRGGPQAAVLGTLGLSYTYFPELDHSASPLAFKKPEGFASKTLKKSGARIGAGAVRLGSKTRFLVGPGVQLNAFAVWGLYEPTDGIWMLGISTADLSKLKKIFGWFD